VATNSCAVRTSPVWGSITSIVCPAQSTNNRSPAGWRWRITGDSFAFPPRLKLAKPGIAVALRVIGAIFFPQQRLRHALVAQLAVDMRPVSLGRTI
jgi:hypothetical protein